MARPITQNRKEYQVARRKSWETKRIAVDPKLRRQLRDIGDQNIRRAIRRSDDYRNSPRKIIKGGGTYHQTVGDWVAGKSGSGRRIKAIEFATAEKARRTKRAYDKSYARSKK